MKKAFCFSLIVMFLALASSPLLVKADDIVVNDVNTITPALSSTDLKTRNTGLFLTEYLRRGGKLDFTQTDPNYGIDDFVNNFSDLVSDVLHLGQNGYEYRYEPFDTGTIFNPIGLVGLGTDVLNFMTSVKTYDNNSEPVPQPTPPPDYEYYIDIINGDGYFWDEFPTSNTFNQNGSIRTFVNNVPPWNDYSYVNWGGRGSLTTSSASQIAPCNPITINIIKSGNDWTYVYNATRIYPSVIRWAPEYVDDYSKATYFDMFGFDSQHFFGNNASLGSSTYTYTYISNSLTNVLANICGNFRHINLYVDGVAWSTPFVNNYSVGIGSGTFIEGTNYPIEYKYDVEVQIDIDDLIDRLEDLINQKLEVTFPDIQDLIVDVDGQPAVAVMVVQPSPLNMDDEYLKAFGPFIPVFLPPIMPVSINDLDIITETSTSAIPDDLKDLFGFIFVGMLFVSFLHRSLE